MNDKQPARRFVVTEVIGDAFVYVLDPAHHARPWALLAGPLSLALEPMGTRTAETGYGAMAWAHIWLVLGFGAYLPYSKHLHILSSEPNVYFRNLEPRGALRKMDLEAEPEPGEPEPVFGAKGLKDLTASVDFEALIVEGRKAGLELESYQTLGRFLLDRGVERWLEPAAAGPGEARAFKARAQVKTLIHPEGMGEVFKVLIQRKETGRGAGAPSSWLHHQEAP